MGTQGADKVELEAKVAVANLADVEQRLRQCGATCIGRWSETDRFFDSDDRRLKNGDSALRLRERKCLDDDRVFRRLTFKGPQQSSVMKTRREIEIAVDADEAIATTSALLTALGFREVIAYSKRRASWQFGVCAVELDEVPNVGTFVEVEGPDETTIREVLTSLNLNDREIIKRSYLSMVMACRQ
jgi:adenylate cyclase class 2